MSDTVVVLVFAGALALFAAAVRYSWQFAAGAMAVQGSPRFGRVLQRLGVDLAAVKDERTLREAAISVRRCLACRDQEACDAWLADGERNGYPPRCPNEAFLRSLSRP
jgi:N-acyl-L-homoserine lactone synthetase